MRLSQVGEIPLLERIRSRFTGRAKGLIAGIGDDAAVFTARGNSLITTDMMIEGVHFDLAWVTPFQLGYKLVSINVSDIYAMGGEPRYLLLNFAASGNCTSLFFDQFFLGIHRALDHYGVCLVGGDISSADRVMLSATAVGVTKCPLMRSGARPGDNIYVTGTVGDAACGLALLKKLGRRIDVEKKTWKRTPLPWSIMAPVLRRQLMPDARDPAKYRSRATAMIDISDGLLIDLGRLCTESRTGAEIFLGRIPVSPEMLNVAGYLGVNALDFALSGGEDYELLFTAPPSKRMPAVCIGTIVGKGVSVIDDHGKRMRVSAKGYEHFAIQG